MNEEVKQIKYLKIANEHLKNRNSALYFKKVKLEEEIQWLKFLVIIETSVIIGIIIAVLATGLLKL
ncbi:hypothetical protein [Lactococcus garvieae]|uniref:hypothetical protein n=1 Tax=Lactococcus garvieae TaxID=1363 RepID=UPI0038544843